MKKTSITVTEALRNFADCVNRAPYQNVTFVLLKNGERVARLVPDDEKVCVGRDLAEALAKTDLPRMKPGHGIVIWKLPAGALRHRPTNGEHPGCGRRNPG